MYSFTDGATVSHMAMSMPPWKKAASSGNSVKSSEKNDKSSNVFAEPNEPASCREGVDAAGLILSLAEDAFDVEVRDISL